MIEPVTFIRAPLGAWKIDVEQSEFQFELTRTEKPLTFTEFL
jgi:hypothetical protein